MIQSLNLYIFKTVLLTMKDETELTGTLVLIRNDTIVLNQGDVDTSISLDEIIDIEYVDTIDDYHTYEGYGEIGGYRFFPVDVASEECRNYFLFNEFNCYAACHLYIRESDDGRTFAKDLRPIRWSHALHYPTLENLKHIFIYQNGDTLVGALESESESVYLRNLQNEQVIFNPEGIEKVLPLPNTDEFVVIEKKDGTITEGIYNGMFRNYIAVRNNEKVEIIDLPSLKAIRYKGVISQPDQKLAKTPIVYRENDVSGVGYVLKFPFLREAVDKRLLVDGTKVEFEPSMINRYPIAKDVVLELGQNQLEPNYYTGKGVIQYFRSDPSILGYIGDNYVVYPYDEYFKDMVEKHRGFISYTSDLIGFQFDPTQIYVVEYSCAQEPSPEKLQPAISIQLITSYSKRDYAYVEVDLEGTIHATTVETAYLRIASQDFQNRKPNVEVEVTCEDGLIHHGFLEDCTREKLFMRCNFSNVEIPLDSINEVRYYSMVTSNLVDMVRVSYPFTPLVIHINDIVSEEDKSLLSSDIVGWVISYRLKHNYRRGQANSKGLMGVDGKIFKVRKIDGRICLFEKDNCVIAEFDETQKKDIYNYFSSPFLSFAAANSIKQIDNYGTFDYPAVCSLRMHGKDAQVYITSVDINPMRRIQKKVQNGYLCGKNDNTCVVQSQDDKKTNVYPILYEAGIFKQSKLDLANFDWRVTYFIGTSEGISGIVLLDVNRSVKRKKEIQKGFIVEYTTDICGIVSDIDYNTGFQIKPNPCFLMFESQGVSSKLTEIDIENRDYCVQYLFCEKNGQQGIGIIAIDNGRAKQHYGYVVTYLSNKACGFITDKEDLTIKLRNPYMRCNSDKYFYASVVRGIAPEDIKTPANYYEVSYNTGNNGSKPAAVNFIRTIQRNVATSASRSSEMHMNAEEARSTNTQQRPSTKVETVLRQKEAIGLQSMLASNQGVYQGADVRFGFINSAFNKVGWIHPFYFNKSYNQNEEFPERTVLAMFEPNKARYIGLDEARLKTTKQTYFVRYVEKGSMHNPATEESYSTIDYDYPVEILKVINKNRCVRADLSLENEELTIIWNANKLSATIPENDEMNQGKADEIHNDIPPLFEGESVLLVIQDSKHYDVLTKESDTAFYFNKMGKIEKTEVQALFRFGVITDFKDGSYVTLNGATDFSTTRLDTAVYNILTNSAFVQLHVVYSCKERQVYQVRRITREEMKLITYSRGFVTEYSAAARQLVIDHEVIHCKSVGTNPMISNECTNGSIVNSEVFLRQVRHPFFDDGAERAELMSFAVDVQLSSAMLTVRYDTGLGTYKGEYIADKNVSFLLLGAESLLKPLEGRSELMDIAPNATGDELVAYIHGQSFNEENYNEDENISVDEIKDVALSTLLLDRSKLKSMQLLPSNRRDEDGMPINLDAASEALRILNGRPNTEETLIANYLICEKYPDVNIPIEKGGHALPRETWMRKQLRRLYEKKCDQVSRMNDYTYAEYAYLLTTLLPVARWKSGTVGAKKVVQAYTKEDCLFRLFLMDFATRDEVQRYNLRNEKPDQKASIDALFANCKSVDKVQNLIAHLLMIGRKYSEDLIGKLSQNDGIADCIREYVRGIDSTLFTNDVSSIIHNLSSKYEQLRKRFLLDIEDISIDTISSIPGYIDELGKCFLKLVCEEDERYFEELRVLVGRLAGYRSKLGFTAQESELIEIYRGFENLKTDIISHSGKESLELIVMGNVNCDSLIERLKQMTSSLLNRMYQETNSFISLEPNFTQISRDQEIIQLILSNGSEDRSFCKTITNISIEIRSLTEGVTIVRTTPPQSLAGGESDEVTVELNVVPGFVGEINLEWSASYRSGVAFRNGKTVYDWLNQEMKSIRTEREKTWSVIESSFQIVSEVSESKNKKAVNPYRKAAEGNPLERQSRDMFVGRKAEKQLIMTTIAQNTGEGRKFIPGSTVILYGQRKCGKTSLINIICSDIREDTKLNDQAIIITFSDILTESCGEARYLSEFREGQYCKILSSFANEVHAYHPDVEKMLLENGVTIPDVDAFLDMSHIKQRTCFDSIFRKFLELDQGKHTVILIMDEFTRLCTAIADIVEAAPENSPEKTFADIPSFIRIFSQNYGFVQLIIGHESMMSALGRLGTLNHTAEFAEKVELHALKSEEAEELIVKPMQRVFGYDVYRTSLGRKAIDRLKDLSGCSPTFLMRLCRDVFTYYVEKCPSTQITDRDIRNVVAEQLNTLTEDNFDIIITEDGDGAGLSREKKTYKFLFAAAKCSITESSRTADENKTRAELNWDEDEYMQIRDKLLRRHVISLAGYGRIKINNGLFLEYVRKRIN